MASSSSSMAQPEDPQPQPAVDANTQVVSGPTLELRLLERMMRECCVDEQRCDEELQLLTRLLAPPADPLPADEGEDGDDLEQLEDTGAETWESVGADHHGVQAQNVKAALEVAGECAAKVSRLRALLIEVRNAIPRGPLEGQHDYARRLAPSLKAAAAMFYAQRLYAFSADVRLNGNDLVRHSPDWQRYLGNICRKWTSQGRRVVIFDRFHVRLSATGGGQLRAPDENPDDARFPLRIGVLNGLRKFLVPKRDLLDRLLGIANTCQVLLAGRDEVLRKAVDNWLQVPGLLYDAYIVESTVCTHELQGTCRRAGGCKFGYHPTAEEINAMVQVPVAQDEELAGQWPVQNTFIHFDLLTGGD